MLQVFHGDACLRHEAAGHPERPDRVRAALAALQAWGPHRVVEPEAATRDDLLGVHTVAHVERVEAACRRGAWLDADTYTVDGSWEAALRSAGAALAVADAARAGRPALSLGRPPGHHATRGAAMGFCLFNNVALAAERLARQGERVAIVDVDVHHGNGTQEVFEARDDVLFVSLHGWPLYPGTGRVEEAGRGRGEGFTLNLPLPEGTGHEGYVEVFGHAVLPTVRAFAPDVILVSAGFDAHWRDPLGNLRLVGQTFHDCITGLKAIQPRLGAILEGGYDLDGVNAGVQATAAALTASPCPVKEDVIDGPRPWESLRPRLAAAHPTRFG